MGLGYGSIRKVNDGFFVAKSAFFGKKPCASKKNQKFYDFFIFLFDFVCWSNVEYVLSEEVVRKDIHFFLPRELKYNSYCL